MSFFGGDYEQVVSRLVDAIDGVPYRFTRIDDYRILMSRSPAAAGRVYWYEILARAHMSASSSLVRGVRWLRATEAAAVQTNLLATAACARGFLEAAADTIDGLCNVPEMLARDHDVIELALSGSSTKTTFANEDMEDQLIHFLYARHIEKGEEAPNSHRKKSTTKYNRWLADATLPRTDGLYALLCQLTHPAAQSLQFCFEGTDNEFTFRSNRDASVLSNLRFEYGDTLRQIPMCAFNPGLMILGVLNYFSVAEFHSPSLLAWDFTGLSGWRKCLAHFGPAQPRCTPEVPLRN